MLIAGINMLFFYATTAADVKLWSRRFTRISARKNDGRHFPCVLVCGNSLRPAYNLLSPSLSLVHMVLVGQLSSDSN